MKVIKKAKTRPVEFEIPAPEIIPPKPYERRPKDKIVFTEDQVRQLEVMAGIGLNMAHISLILGFSADTIERRCKEDSEVKEALARGRAKAESQVAQTAFALAKSGKYPVMTMFWLKCRAKWREIHEQEVKSTQEIIFKTKIGEAGKIQQEQIERGKDDL